MTSYVAYRANYIFIGQEWNGGGTSYNNIIIDSIVLSFKDDIHVSSVCSINEEEPRHHRYTSWPVHDLSTLLRKRFI